MTPVPGDPPRLAVTLAGSNQAGKSRELFYEILVFDGKRQWSLERCHNDFQTLAQAFQSRQGAVEATMPALPRRPYGLRMRLSHRYRDGHFKELGRWLQTVVNEPFLVNLPELMEFLRPPESALGRAITDHLRAVSRRGPLLASISSSSSTEDGSSFSSQDRKPSNSNVQVHAAMQLYANADFQFSSMESHMHEEVDEAARALAEARAAQQVRDAARSAARAEAAARAAAEADAVAEAAEAEARAVAEVRAAAREAVRAEASARAAEAEAAARAEEEARTMELVHSSRARQARAREAAAAKADWAVSPTPAMPYAQPARRSHPATDSFSEECVGCNGTGVDILGNPCGMCNGSRSWGSSHSFGSSSSTSQPRNCDDSDAESTASSMALEPMQMPDMPRAQGRVSFTDDECFGCNGTGVDILGSTCRMCNGRSMMQVTVASSQASSHLTSESASRRRPPSAGSLTQDSLSSRAVVEVSKLRNVCKGHGRAERFVDKVLGDKEIQRINCSHTAAAVLDLHHASAEISEIVATYLSKGVQVHRLITNNPDADVAFARLTAAYRHFTEGLPWYFGRRGEVCDVEPDEDFEVFQGVTALIPEPEEGEVVELSRLRAHCTELLERYESAQDSEMDT